MRASLTPFDVIKNANAWDGLMIVDDVFVSGRRVEALIAEIRCKSRLKMPDSLRLVQAFTAHDGTGTGLFRALQRRLVVFFRTSWST